MISGLIYSQCLIWSSSYGFPREGLLILYSAVPENARRSALIRLVSSRIDESS